VCPKRKIPAEGGRRPGRSAASLDHPGLGTVAQGVAGEGQDARRRARAAYRRRRVLACGLIVLAALVAVSHLLEHAGIVQVMSPGLQDVLIGYPTAAVLLVVAGVVWGT